MEHTHIRQILVLRDWIHRRDLRGRRAAAALAGRLFPEAPPRIEVLRDALPAPAHLPGDVLLLPAGLIEAADSPDVIAGHLLIERLRSEAADPVRPLLDHMGIGATLRLLTSGAAPAEAAKGYGEAFLARAPDPELEAEFLRRLMVKLGVSQEQSKAVAAAPAPRAQSARMATVDNKPVVQLDEGFDRAWRRIGLALDRTGFTVEDRNRNEGTYFVRYVAPNAEKKEPGFFGKLFSSSNATPPLKYRILVRSQGESTTVSVLNEAGVPESSANAERIVRVIADDLK